MDRVVAHLRQACVAALVVALAAVCGGQQAATAAGRTIELWPAADHLFRQDARWQGADDAYSVDLGNGRVVWLFADTFVSDPPQHRRPLFPTARNTVGLMTGTDPTTATMTFHWRTTAGGQPASFFPEDGDTWFWPGDGERLGAGGPLLLFLMRVARDPAGPPGFDFRVVGWQAVLVPNPDDDPDAWVLEPLASPQNPWRIIVGSATVLVQDGWLYAFSVREPSHDVHLVRWRLDDALQGDLGSPEWWFGSKHGFVPQASLTEPPRPLFHNGQVEFTVHETPSGRFVLVQTVGFGPATVGVRTAPALTGPWSGVRSVWTPPEASMKGALIYAAKAHPELDAGGRLAVTYIPSNLDIGTVSKNNALYYPHFVRFPLDG
jgi:hypothetical protein